MKCFKNVKAYIGGKGITLTDITFDQTIIATDRADGEQIKLPADALVLPGFIDEHIHGAGGADVMDCSLEALSVIAETLAREGTTAFLATTMTQSRENILKAVRTVASYRLENCKNGAELLGVHLEGPHLSKKYAGAQLAEFMTDPDISFMRELIASSADSIKMVTLAPERKGSEKFIRFLKDNKITISIGHTGAKYEDIRRAVLNGAQCVTHVFNAQSPLHHRDLGTVGGALISNDIATELIADTLHVSVPAIRLLCKNKPREKLILITDSMRAKGAGDGTFDLGGQQVFVENGKAYLKDGTLAGSVLQMNRAVQNLVEKAGVSVERAVDAATINPAENLGISQTHGSIREGKSADFAVLDKSFNVIFTIRAGEIIFQA